MAKKLLFSLISALFFLLSFTTAFSANIEYIHSQVSDITQGITLTKYEMFMSDRRFVNAYVATADLNYPQLSLELLTSKAGTSSLSTVSNMAKNSGANVAINADFFNYGNISGTGSPIGTVYFKKSMLSTPAVSGGMYTIMQDSERNVFAELIDYQLILTLPNGEEKKIGGKNKATDLAEIMMYDNGYSETSLGSTETQYEIVVKNNIVKEIRFSSEPIKLEDNMYVLCGLSDHDSTLIDILKEGDKIEIKEISSVNFNNLILAGGAGAKLVEDGNVLSEFSHNVGGINPRSAFGISENKKTVFFVAVDGRSTESGGMTMGELAEFMHYIGAHEAINLDGGGSTALVTKNLKTNLYNVENTPSGGTERKVATSFAVKTSAKPTDKLYHLKIYAQQENVFTGSHITLNVEGYDEYFYPVDINKNQIAYSVSGVDGYFKDDSFFPTSAGIATINVRMPNGANANIKLRVLDRAQKIESENRKIDTQIGQSREINLYVTDENGYGSYVPLSDMNVNFSDNIAYINENSIIGTKNGSAVMSIKFKDAVSYLSVCVGDAKHIDTLPTNKVIADSKDKTNAPEQSNVVKTFAVFGALRESDTLFNNLVMKKSFEKISASADRAFFLSTHKTNNTDENMTIPSSVCYPFTSFEENGDKYIILDTEDDFMSAKEWVWFLNEVKTAAGKNLFVFMQTDCKFTSKKETELLKTVLSEAADRKLDVYVFCQGMRSESYAENGVRYIKTPGFYEQIRADNFIFSNQNLEYTLVEIDKNGSVTYRFIPIY